MASPAFLCGCLYSEKCPAAPQPSYSTHGGSCYSRFVLWGFGTHRVSYLLLI